MQNKTVLLAVVILFLVGNVSIAQTQAELNTFNKDRLKLQQKAMFTLGTWSIANIAWGTAGTFTSDGPNQQFHNMNILWNSINLALAIPGYIGARRGKYELSFRKTFKEQSAAEKTFLFNAGLDAAYIMGGVYLVTKSKSATTTKQHDQNLGYGNSLILQGGFLFLLDYTFYTIHSRHGNKKLNPFLDNITIGASSIGYRYQF